MSYKVKNLFAATVIFFCISAAGTRQISAAATMQQTKELQQEIAPEKEEPSLHMRAKDSGILPAPETLVQEKTTYQSVTLGWSAVPGATGYQVEYGQKDGDFTVAGMTMADASSFQCKGLVTGVTYQFRVCALDAAGEALMKKAFDKMGLSARSYDRILRVARTIADLDGSADLRPPHVAEAVQYRTFRFED